MLSGPHGAAIARAMPVAMKVAVATPVAMARGLRSGGIALHWSRRPLHNARYATRVPASMTTEAISSTAVARALTRIFYPNPGC